MTGQAVNILLVEDNPGDQRLVQEMLSDCGRGEFRLLIADQIGTAMAILDRQAVDLILLDLRLPDGDGLESMVKINAVAPGIPVVVLSNVDDETLAVKAVRQGAQDFLLKQHINGPLLIRSLRYALERRRLEQHLHHLAHHDALTDLPNRKLFYDRFGRELAAARRHQRVIGLMLLDLNEFKRINDMHGHQVGDELLRQVASRLTSCLRASDCAARLGGDEFLVFLGELGDAQHARRVAQKVLDVLAPPYAIGPLHLNVNVSLGVAIYPGDGDDADTLVKKADAAMYLAKADGREMSRFRLYDRELDGSATGRSALEEALREALARGEFVVNYQPQFDLHSNRAIGVEALLRWQRDGELVMPCEFMPTLEDSGLVVEIGGWVLATVCRQAMDWQAAGLPAIKVAVNISPRQFREPELVERIAAALRDSGLAPGWLELEIAESSLHEDEDFAVDRLRQLSSLGVRLALDNFRAQAIALRDLQRFPIDTIKLDRSIVRDMAANPADADMVRAVISVAHVFKIKGVAEGVETAAQAEMLRHHACDDAQGFAFAKPLSPEAIAHLLGASATLH